MVSNGLIRDKVAELQAKGKADREWWDQERASIQSKFMKELEDDAGAGVGKAPGSDKNVTSDEDAVLVEAGGPAASGSIAGSKGGTKKRKGKK